jgi:UDP-GlcNAc:undecaprenyl-phosphate GlcNAc-1-phosphate transferase
MTSTLRDLLALWPVPLLAFASAWAATWLCRRLALRWHILDRPDQGVKTHAEPVAYLGGVGILIGLSAGIWIAWGVASGGQRRLLVATLGAGALACLVGVADDRWRLRARYKILGQLLAALVFLTVGAEAQGIRFWGEGLAVCVLVLVATNSLNLLDGLDGLCGGVTAIMSLGFLLLAGTRTSRDPVIDSLCLALMGSLAGFLYFNRPPARIFMGDAGSLLLGMVIAAVMTLLHRQAGHLWLSCLLVMGLPLLDTGTAMARRTLNRRSLFAPDRSHLYDQIMDRGATLHQTLRRCYGFACLSVLLGLVVSILPLSWALGVCAASLVVAVIVICRYGYLRMGKQPDLGTCDDRIQSVTVKKVHSCSH